MSSVLHPVGPEAPQTYWIRRAVVIGAAMLALIVVIALIVSQNNSGSVVAAPTPTPTALASSGPPPYTPTPTPSSTSTQGSTSTASSTSTPSSKPKADPGDTDSGSTASARPGGSASSSAPPKSDGPLACAADRLRPTITGERKLKPEQDNTFSISLINGSGQTCTVKVDGDNFELKIYSGTDRIWSSKDCSTAVKSLTKKVAKEDAVEWKMSWTGRRSADDCKQRPEVPKAGTYFATAQYEGAKPVQLRMIVAG